jgi:hypothetical protein
LVGSQAGEKMRPQIAPISTDADEARERLA